MAVSYILPLKAPAPLPATGVSIVTFKVWKNTLVAHLQQDANHYHFMPEGRYSTWRAAEFGNRIENLHATDPDRIAAQNKRNQTEQQLAIDLERLLQTRNAQLAKFVTHIATLCHHTENDDVTTYSTSLEWIFDYLRRHYGLTTKGANFMNIADHVFTVGTPHQTFYKQYRASFVDNLRKQGDRVKYKNNLVLNEDEKLSPSFENAIVLWALEKIDPRLPQKVKKDYGHQMTDDTTLRDLQAVIFENITSMIEDLDQAQTTKAFALQSINDDDTSLNAVFTRNKQPRTYKSSQKPKNSFPGQSARSSNPRKLTPKNLVTDKFCRICNLAGSDPRIYTSHEIGNCSRLTLRDMDSLRSCLMINSIVEDEEPQQPEYVLQPGWDDAEALQFQSRADSE